MPRGKMGGQPTPKSEQARLIWGTFGERNQPKCNDWDPKATDFAQALLEVLASGCAVMLGTAREGSAVSITIYQDDYKYPRVWIADAEELDDWSRAILAKVKIEVPAAD